MTKIPTFEIDAEMDNYLADLAEITEFVTKSIQDE